MKDWIDNLGLAGLWILLGLFLLIIIIEILQDIIKNKRIQKFLKKVEDFLERTHP